MPILSLKAHSLFPWRLAKKGRGSLYKSKMDSLSMGSCRLLLLLIFFSSFHFLSVSSVEFEVGTAKGWVLPSSKDDDQMYNQWASKNRFKINDTLHFKYTKDSVLEVTDAEYEKCRSSHPIFFSNNGDTVYTFDRAGLFYFISGVAGHCERGQKMIIKVLEPETPPSAASQNDTSASSQIGGSGAIEVAAIFPTVVIFVMSFIGLNFFY